MPNSRDRHQRGLRGPMTRANPYTRRPFKLPGRLSAAEYFLQCARDSLQIISQNCPQALAGIDIGVEDVPGGSFDISAMDRVPLAAAMEASKERAARIVIFRRPLERRAADRADLRWLVHSTLVEQLSALTHYPMHELDPLIEEES